MLALWPYFRFADAWLYLRSFAMIHDIGSIDAMLSMVHYLDELDFADAVFNGVPMVMVPAREEVPAPIFPAPT